MAETYVHNGTEFKNAQQIYGNVSGTFQEVNAAYANVGGTFKLVFSAFQATSFVTLSSGTGTFTVPANANALHVKAAVGAGGGAAGGADYDKAGGESAGAGGGSGGYVSDKVFSLNPGDTLTFSIGSGGAAGNQTANFKQPRTASAGTSTTLSSATVGSLFVLTGGGGSSGTGGAVQGPLRTNTAGTAGTATVSSTLTSGNFRDSDGQTKALSTLTAGPTGTFNDSGNGSAGSLSGSGNCGGDNCRIDGFSGGASYDSNIAGGTAGSSSGAGTNGGPGTRGSGGGGGAAQVNAGSTDGGVGGDGEIVYRFIKVL
jgi:hypothetical protein